MKHFKQWLVSSAVLSLALMSGATAQIFPSTDYRLGPGDVVRINVFGYPDLTADVRINGAGNLSYAFVPELRVENLTPHELEAELTTRLGDKYLRSPQVSVLVIDYRSHQVAVMGQVTRPGQYPLDKPKKVSDLLADAGGLVNEIAGETATLLRPDGSKATIDLYALFNGDSQENLPLAGGDTIYVPRAPQFYVYGEVQHPGAYRLQRNMTVSQAISAGGGTTQRGSERRALLKRIDGKGRETRTGVKSSDKLLPDDVLLVRQSLF
jgi:polysaccharide export outer membrane protein